MIPRLFSKREGRARSILALAVPLALIAQLTLAAAPTTVVSSQTDQEKAADSLLQLAHQAWLEHDLTTLAPLAPQLESDPLSDFPAYWVLSTRLSQHEELPAAALRNFLEHYPHSPLIPALRHEWLRSLASRHKWEEFTTLWPQEEDPDTALVCAHITAALALNLPAPWQELPSLWSHTSRWPDSCTALLSLASAQGVLSQNLIWSALRQALARFDLKTVLWLQTLVDPTPALDHTSLDQVLLHPQRLLRAFPPAPAPNDPGQRIRALLALVAWARQDSAGAADYWEQHGSSWSTLEQNWGWQRIAAAGAAQQQAQALEWFRVASPLEDDVLAEEWARLALRYGKWPALEQALQQLSEPSHQQARWRYWRARTFQELGRPSEALPLLQGLARESNYFGVLALEELGQTLHPPPLPAAPDPHELAAIQARLARALRLNQLQWEPEARLEWNFVNHTLDGHQQRVAAQVAFQQEWYNRAIYSMERPNSEPDWELRFPQPYLEQVRKLARSNGLEPAWVFGLMRQESHFYPGARSHSGALGLMQLMPDTARWLAGKQGHSHFRVAEANAIPINLALGTYYLGMLLTQLGNPVLASAAYNAGPQRARTWASANPTDPTIFVETIPFQETRGYVENVMFNTTVYGLQLEPSPLSLHQRLATVLTSPPPLP